MPPSAGVMLSSPARHTLHDRLIMLSSSPVFPSLDDLIARSPKKSALRSGSRAAPIPENATRSFTSAADLLRAGQTETEEEEVRDVFDREPPQKSRKTPKTAKEPKVSKKSTRAPKTVIDLSADTPTAEPVVPTTKRRRKPLAEKNCKPVSKPENAAEQCSSPLKEKPWKKYKAAQDEDHQIDAPEEELNVSNSLERKDTKDLAKTSKQSSKKPTASNKISKSTTPEPLNLEHSLPRRLDWTPPKSDAINLMSDASETQEAHAPGSLDTADMAKDVFKNLRDNYGCNEGKAISVRGQSEQPNTLGKRKLTDLETTTESKEGDGPAKPVPKVKTKAPRKKPRTITELATAAYVVKPAEPQDSSDPSQIGHQQALTIIGEGQDSAGLAGAAKPKRKAKASKVTKKKAEPKKQILLSPQAALRQSAAQDFVFGTSSQLAFEQSPTFLRDLQAAIQASNAAQDNPFSSPIQTTAAARRKASRKLWSVGARDEDGELLDLEVIDLVNSPTFPEEDAVLNPILNPWKDLPPEPASFAGDSLEVEVLDVGSAGEIPKSHFFQTLQAAKAVSEAVGIDTSAGACEPSSANKLVEIDDVPPPSNQQQSQEDPACDKSSNIRKEAPRPKYELFTDIQLAKQIKSYGFKPVKKRSAMIALLDQCWTSKNQRSLQPSATFSSTAAASGPRGKSSDGPRAASETASPPKPRGRPKKTALDTTKPTSNKVAASPKRPRGRPRKDSLAALPEASGVSQPQATIVSTPKRKAISTQLLAEIADSDCEEMPSPSVVFPEQGFSPTGVNLAASEEAETEMSLTVDPTDQQAALFKHITKAVTTAPRSKDPSNPSWHEKMLMYDPIVLEDLAAWLNSGQLTQVGFDGEASPADVKKWCESKSICCLWRINVNGKERKRF